MMKKEICKYIRNLLTISLIVFVIPVVAVLMIVPDQEAYLHQWKVKRLRYEQLESPRILFIGDSNLAFGLDSRAIGDSLGCNIQNAGLHGGIGLQYELQEYDELIKKDDIVVICSTYDQYINGYGEYLTLPVTLFHNDWHGIEKLSYQQWKVFLSGFMQIFKQNNKKVESEVEYRASYFNEYGDEYKHWALAPLDTIPEGYLPKGSIDNDVFEFLFAKVEKWENLGAKVFFLPPCVPFSYYDRHKEVICSVSAELSNRKHSYIIPADSCVYSDSYMYDGYYHMNKRGVDRFGNAIVNKLRTLL